MQEVLDKLIEQYKPLALEYYNAVEDFVLDMTVEYAHLFLFLTTHFPIFFVIQSIFICICVRKYNPKITWYKSLSVSYLMELLGRALVAFFTNRRPPILETPLYTPIFLLIWYLINASPWDIIFKIFNSGFFFFILQFINCLIQVRETCHGVDIGLRSFPASISGVILISVILSCTECIVWHVFFDTKCRFYSIVAFLRNILMACSYFVITQYPEYFTAYFEPSKELVKIVSVAVVSALNLFDCIIFGLNDPRSFDVTLISYISKIFTYYGQ